MFTEQNNRVYIPMHFGFIIDEADHITHCVADGSYTWVYFDNREPILATRRLNVFQSLLKENIFIRCHKSFLVNVYFIKEFHTNGKNKIILENGIEIKVAYRKLKEFKLRVMGSYMSIPA